MEGQKVRWNNRPLEGYTRSWRSMDASKNKHRIEAMNSKISDKLVSGDALGGMRVKIKHTHAHTHIEYDNRTVIALIPS